MKQENNLKIASKDTVDVQIFTVGHKKYLAIISCIDNQINIITTADIEFYEELINLKEEIEDLPDLSMSKEAKEVLEFSFSEIKEHFDYDDEIYNLGRERYIYNNQKDIEEYLSGFKDLCLYDWHTEDYYKNVPEIVFWSKEDFVEDYYSECICFEDGIFIILSKKVKSPDKQAYFIINEFINLLYNEKTPDDIGYCHFIKKEKSFNEDEKVLHLEKLDAFIEDDFSEEILEISRNLRLPMKEMERIIEEEQQEDDNLIRIAYRIKEEIPYPIEEIIKRIEEYRIYKKYEQQKEETQKKKRKWFK